MFGQIRKGGGWGGGTAQLIWGEYGYLIVTRSGKAGGLNNTKNMGTKMEGGRGGNYKQYTKTLPNEQTHFI